ncbi:DNA primase [Candidatus Micrarchaeota archaeon]|nr:DNA primase [Candidatus Micrarchaeota archaeon]MBU1165372.1 DNA primase [Candidatus Micrarchaeota archaeon]MBU1886229.1 DNA primase [Candidatus Micrarchaeota archaeon]
MAKTYIDTVKYLIYTEVEIGGLVEKPDVVGAIFGQTEGLLGDELDLRDLQKNGRIGRIEVDLNGKNGKTIGVIKIPSSLDMVETCIIAAALETVDRVGPCEAKLKISKVEDTRNLKRKQLVDRAKILLKTLLDTEIPESKEISQTVRDEVKTAEIVVYGRDKLSSGPGIDRSNEVIFVEGRADVVNLLKNDITNVIGIGGAKVTRTIVDLSKKKEVTVFLDGDRGGDIILNELVQGGVDIDFVARAPTGIEVEELTRKEIIKYLRNKTPYEQNGERKMERRAVMENRFSRPQMQTPPPQQIIHPQPQPPIQENRDPRRMRRRDIKQEVDAIDVPDILRKDEQQDIEAQEAKQEPKRIDKTELMAELDALANTLRARFYNEKLEMVKEVPVRDVIKTLGETHNINAIVFDGIITQRLADLASKQGVKVLIGLKIGNVNKVPENIEIISKNK